MLQLAFGIEKYNREKHFGKWKDFDKDCQNTRHEVLIRDAIEFAGVKLTFKENKKGKDCLVLSGVWYDPFTDSLYTLASDLDIDHIVPLKQAWISGAHAWTKEERITYANDMSDVQHLMTVTDHHNQSKGDKAPHQWMPKNKKFHKPYCRIWCRIKVRYKLTVTVEELIFLQNVLGNEPIIYPKIRKGEQ